MARAKHGSYYATDEGGLHDYQTGEWLRDATPGEIAASREAAQTDGGAGVIGGDELDEEESD